MFVADRPTTALYNTLPRCPVRLALVGGNQAVGSLLVRAECSSSAGGGGNSDTRIHGFRDIPSTPVPDLHTGVSAGGSQPSQRDSRGSSQTVISDAGSRSGFHDRFWLCIRRWLCGCICLEDAAAEDSSGAKRSAGPRAQLQSQSTSSQPAGASLSNFLALPAQRLILSVASGRQPSSSSVPAGDCNSRGSSNDSRVGPLPSRQLHFLQGAPDNGAATVNAPTTTADGSDTAASGPGGARALAHMHLLGPGWSVAAPGPGTASNLSSGNRGVTSGQMLAMHYALTGGGGASHTAVAAGSRASSAASFNSSVTTTSRPSRWGMLAGILSAGLRSFSQLAGIVEPDTGNLSQAAVHDITRRASRLDIIRAVGQVVDLHLVGSGSMGLVYRGRLTSGLSAGARGGSGWGSSRTKEAHGGGGGGIVCVKYLVARGADGMAAPATEGLLSRALVHPNIVQTYSWHVTRVTVENFKELPELLATMTAHEQRRASAAMHGRCGTGKGRRTGGAGGSGSGGSGGLRFSPVPAAISAAAAAVRPASCSTTLMPVTLLGLTSGQCGGGGRSAASAAEHGSNGGSRAGRKNSRASSSTLPVNLLEFVHVSGAAGAAPRNWCRSPGGSPLTRVVFSRHRSFTVATAAPRTGLHGDASVPLLRRSSLAPNDCHSSGVPAASGTIASAHLLQQTVQQLQPCMPASLALSPPPQRPQQSAEGLESSRTDYTDSCRSSDMVCHSILEQAAACNAAAVAVATAASALGPHCRPSGGTVSSFINQDSSSQWFPAIPNPSNHAPVPVSVPLPHSSGRNMATGAAAAADGNEAEAEGSIATAATTPRPPSAPVAIAPNSSGAAASINIPATSTSGGRGRGMLVWAGSRLQFTTTPFSQPSIPEEVQTVELDKDISLNGGSTPSSIGELAYLQADRLRLFTSLAGEEEMGAAHMLSIDVSSAFPSCVTPAMVATALGAGAVAESSLSGSATGSGGKSTDGGRLPSDILPGDSLIMRSPLRHDNRQPMAEDCSSGRSRIGLLAAALAAANAQQGHDQGHAQSRSQSRGPSQTYSSGLTISSGFCSSSGGRPSLAVLPLPPPPPLSSSVPSAAGDPRQLHMGAVGGVGCSQSRTTSTVLSRSTTISCMKPLSSTVLFSNLSQMLETAGTAGSSAATRTATGISSAAELVRSVNTSGGIVGGVCCAPASSGTARTYTSSVDAGPSAVATAASVEDSDLVRQEALERGWRTLNQVMWRLKARPGDYLTRIVMEDADQGSLLGAIRNGRFGVEGELLRATLLTALDIARGMAYLHSHNVIHGDLKPSNVLLCTDPCDPRGFIAKVSDFGLSRIISRDHEFIQNLEAFPAGTVRYLAPEVVGGASFKASDVWSFAVVIWQLVTGESAPWPGLNGVQIMMGVMQNELRLSVPPSVYPPLAHLINSCLSHDHKARPLFDDIVSQLQEALDAVMHAPDQEMSRDKSLHEFQHVIQVGSSQPVAEKASDTTGSPFTVPAVPTAPFRYLFDRLAAKVGLPALGRLGGHVPKDTSSVGEVLPAARVPSASSEPKPSVLVDGGVSAADPHLLSITTAAGLLSMSPTIAAAAVYPSTSAVTLLAADSDSTDFDEEQLHCASQASRRGFHARSEMSDEGEQEQLPTSMSHESDPASTTTASGADGPSSLDATSPTFTAAASSNTLTQGYSSWANMTTISLLDREQRISAGTIWPSASTLNLVTSTAANATSKSSSLYALGPCHGGLQGSSGLSQMSRLMTVMPTSFGGGSTSAGALALALERHGSTAAEMFGQSHTYLAASLPDDVPMYDITGVRGAGAGNHSSRMGTGFTGGAPQVNGGGHHFHYGSNTSHVAVVGCGSEFNYLVLPPVHEEQVPTSSSGFQTHGSSLSSGVMMSVDMAAERRALAQSSGTMSAVGYGGAEATLPSMLQAGLIVLGDREAQQ